MGRPGAAVTLDRAAYHYRAARADGGFESGVVEAATRDGASALLVGRGLFPIELAHDVTRETRRRMLPVADLALGLRVLATLLEAGLPMARALAALDGLVPVSWQAALPSIRASVREGKSLGAALAESPLGMPPVVIGIVQAGEAGSDAAGAVRRAAELMERAAATRSALRNALAYPVLLACAGTASVALLVGVVLPRFAAILSDLGQALPPTTRLVLAVADRTRMAALPGLVALGLTLALGRAWVTREAGRTQWHGLLLALPIIGSTRRAAASARASEALAALLTSGVPIAPAMRHAARASGDAALAARFLVARESVIVGQRLSCALEAAEATTPTTARLVRAGEETGALATMLIHAARLESDRAEQLVKSAVRLLEPALIIAFGGLVALVAAALLQAIYSVRPG